MARKLDGSYITANTITTTQLTTTVVSQISAGGGPKVTTITYPNSATAAVNTGNESVVLTGTGFDAGVQVYVNGAAAPAVSRTNANSLSFTTPALTTGTTYPLYVVNPDGGTAVVVPGMVVSAGPVWVTASPLEQWNKDLALSRTLVANSDSTVSYSLADGSSLPAGLSLAANGLLSGTLTSPPVAQTTYNFTVTATDLETQKSSKAFSINATTGIVATGGTVSNITGYRVHTFTSSGTFEVTAGTGTVEYLVVAGGGGGGGTAPSAGSSAGGGAGGFRTGTGLSVSSGSYAVTVGAGGAGGPAVPGSPGALGNAGSNGSSSIFSTITSAGGGGGGAGQGAGGAGLAGRDGGSGGGGGYSDSGGRPGGSGNIPSVSPSQGNTGGSGGGGSPYGAGGGGGAGAVGGSGHGGAGGAGASSSISGSSLFYAGGGGGGCELAAAGSGGSGVGGNGAQNGQGSAGTTNRGGGGGGAGGVGAYAGGAGGSGIVIIRYAV